MKDDFSFRQIKKSRKERVDHCEGLIERICNAFVTQHMGKMALVQRSHHV